MSNLTDTEINHRIATEINRWEHVESIFYTDHEGTTCYLADYCNSTSHALDLAHREEIGLAPTKYGWSAYNLNDSLESAEDNLLGRAICLCLLKMRSPLTKPDQNETNS